MPETPASRKWRRLCEEFAVSDLSLRAFSEARGIHPATFRWWRSRLQRSEARHAAFAEVVVSGGDTPLRISRDAVSAHVWVDANTDLVLLKRVLAALS